MTNEEEKILEEILDEENDITLEDAAEEAEELQEETQDEVKEIREEIPEDVRLDPDEIRERPVLRGGLRGAADPNMIQKHIDNFLAMLCGETPVDSNVRTSAEYWLKRLATGEGGGSTKKIYYHPIAMVRTTGGISYHMSALIIDNNPEAYTKTTFLEKAAEFSRLVPFNGFYNDGVDNYVVCYAYTALGTSYLVMRDVATGVANVSVTLTSALSDGDFYDGVNAIN